jgi:DNA-binding Lrp family transcriptional regulator
LIDTVDRQILDILRQDARQPLKAIAGAVGLARSSVSARIARMEREGVITGYRAEIAIEQAGGAAAMVSLRLASTPLPSVVAAVCADPAVYRCYSLAGETDLLVEIASPSSAGVNAARDRLSSLPGVVQARTALILKRDKAG